MTSAPIVLFIGDDASSTQIAESLLRRLVGDRVEIRTAGAQPPNPGGREDQMLLMMGLNPAHEERLSVRALSTSDRVIVLGCALDVARVPGRQYDEWDLEDSSLEERIELLAAELITDLDLAAEPSAEEQRGRRAGQRTRPTAASWMRQRRDRLRRSLRAARRRARTFFRRRRDRRDRPE